ncbi:MAG: transporter, partial [Candidatus Sericytochromatia bacterium]
MSPPIPNFEALPSMRAVRTPGGVRLLAGLLIALAGTSALALAFTPWQQTASGKGRVIAYAPLDRQQALEAPLDGRVTRWHVQEG